jgi:deoxycytidine triphosphate deaminase
MQAEIEEGLCMPTILADHEVRKLLGTVIVNADEKRLNPNGIEIRLGSRVLFHSTDEEKELGPDTFLKVSPGETVTISSYETFHFTKEAIGKIFPGCDLMALVTPTTTMMREGIMQTTTKVDSGWYGNLNWGLRNSSVRDFILGYKEPIFKLTLFLLEGREIPEIPYGQRVGDRYQHTEGLARSARTIPASIPKSKIISSTVERIDPKKQLREAGYPFDHIGTELAELHGKFEVVSSDVALLKNTIAEQTNTLSGKVEQSQKTVLEKVESLFDRKFLNIAGGVIGVILMMYGGASFLQSHGITGTLLGWIALAAGLGCLVLVYILTKRKT